MKKALSILLLFIYLQSSTQLMEFLKIPYLIEHYLEHSNQDNSMTIGTYIYMHYAHLGEQNDNNDMKLPFKSLNTNLHSITSFLSPSPLFILVKTQINIELKQIAYSYSTFYTSQFLSNIWQPPKTC